MTRIQGTDRYSTAVKVAQAAYPNGAGTVFLASGANFPDALAAGPAAAKLGGPLLLTPSTSLPASVAAELTALKPTTVYLVGGTSAVSAGVESAVQAAVGQATVTRLDGPNRYATEREVVSTVFPTATKAFIATGTGFADALSAAAAAGSAGEPVVLVNGAATSLDSATVTQLKTLGVTDVSIAGGPSAVSTGIQSQLGSLLGGASHVTRYGGADRYATSALIGASFQSATSAYFASGAQFPDALAASAVAGAQHAPLFTVQPGCVPNQTGADVTSLGVTSVTLVGGTQSLSSRVAALTPCQLPFTTAPTPTISGRVEVGQALTVNPGSWAPTPSRLTFQWRKAASGSTSYTAISGATGASYTVPSGDAGDTFEVTATASRSGYLTTAKTSAATAAATPGAELAIAAGIGDAPINGDPLKSPVTAADVAVDTSGNRYIADPDADVVEKVDTTGQLSVFAGTGTAGTPVNGAATKSPLEAVTSVAVDSAGDVYIADSEYIEKVTPDGILSIVAGDGDFAYGAKPTAGPALNTAIAPTAVAVDGSGDLYVADEDGYLAKIAGGTLSVVAGTGASGGVPTVGPAKNSALGSVDAIAVDTAGDVFLADPDNSEVEKIDTNGYLSIAAGGGHVTVTNGPATNSSLAPVGVAVDSAGDLYMSDYNGYLEKVDTNGNLTIVAGTGKAAAAVAGPAAASPLAPLGVGVDPTTGNVYVGDQYGHVDEIDTTGNLSVVAGIGNAPIKGAATSSPVNPSGVAVDSAGDLFVADSYAGVVDEIAPTGQLSVIAGNGDTGAVGMSTTVPVPVKGPALDSPMAPVDVAVDSSGQHVYIADELGYVEMVTLSTDTLSFVAGNGGQDEPVAGPATSTSIRPNAIALDAKGSLFIADDHGYVEKVTQDTLSIVAGDGDYDAPTPGPATHSALADVTGIAVDGSDNLYLADQGNEVVEKVTSAGVLSVVAGGGEDPVTSGRATSAGILPVGVAVDGSGNLFIADQDGYLEKASGGLISRVAGNGTLGTPTAGLAANTAISPADVAIDGSGELYLADSSGYVAKVTQ